MNIKKVVVIAIAVLTAVSIIAAKAAEILSQGVPFLGN